MLMNTRLRKFIEDAHDVNCPVCGAKAGWRPKANGGWTTIACHDELLKLVSEREQDLIRMFFDGDDKGATVKLAFGQRGENGTD